MAEDFDIEALLEAPYNNVSKISKNNNNTFEHNFVIRIFYVSTENVRHRKTSQTRQSRLNQYYMISCDSVRNMTN